MMRRVLLSMLAGICLLGAGTVAVGQAHAAPGLNGANPSRVSAQASAQERAKRKKGSKAAKGKKPKKKKAAAGLVVGGAVAGGAVAGAALAGGAESASSQQNGSATASPKRGIAASANEAGRAEARLIEIYRQIGLGKSTAALELADSLVRDHPNFQLAQLVRGDLLTSRSRPIEKLGEVPDTTARLAAPQLADLREESRARLQALRERPPAGAAPNNFLAFSTKTKHALAIDVSRSRLYLLANTPTGMKLVSDYYVSVGKAGAEKFAEGDLRTPLGVYFLSSSLDPKTLKDLYGSGAITLNYPNPLDTLRGKGGSGIWLHGTPQAQFSRAPKATDGCVVVTNSDFLRIASTVELRNTPIVVAQSLQWVQPAVADAERKAFVAQLEQWKNAKSQANISTWLATYSPNFKSFDKTLREWYPGQESAIKSQAGQAIELRDMSLFAWRDAPGTQQPLEAMVVTYTEVRAGAKSTPVVRQYWSRTNNQWKIVFEGVLP